MHFPLENQVLPYPVRGNRCQLLHEVNDLGSGALVH